MSMVKKFISYYKPHWKLFAIDMLCAFLVACCDLVYPLIAQDIINVYVPNRQLRLLLAYLLRQFSKDKANKGVSAFVDVNGFE